MCSSRYHLAQVNIARMLKPLDSPVMAGFVSQLPVLNALADGSPGFVWRLAGPEGDATAVRAYHDPLILFNLSVWESLEALKAFTYNSGHLAAFRARAQWFERPTRAHMALWWVPVGHLPGVEEAAERLEYRREHGDTPVAFSFVRPFPKPEEPSADPAAARLNPDPRAAATARSARVR